MSDLIDTTEMYLRTVFELQEEGIPPLRARIAERLSQSGPTVSQTVARMERDGLLHVGDDRQILLTTTGNNLAARVMRKHRLAECMLVELLGVPWDEVHAEACRWEHVISDGVERRIYNKLNQPATSPFGNAIPALNELDPALQTVNSAPSTGPRAADSGLLTLMDAATKDVSHIQVLRIDETAQADEATLAAFRRAGLHPGGVVKCRRRGDQILVGSGGEYTEVPITLSTHILVVPTRPQQSGESHAS